MKMISFSLLYWFVVTSYAAKPSKIPSDTKVGKELYEQYCQGCHGSIDKPDPSSKESSEDTSKIEQNNSQKTSHPESETDTKSPSQNHNTLEHPKELRSTLSKDIVIIGQHVIPSIESTTYSKDVWLMWVLEGKGMMPAYNQVFHATDALKIKTYLDGL